MRRGLKFMVHRKLAPALQSWLAALAPSDKQDSMTKALRHLLHRGLSRGWVGWHEQWLEATRERENASRSLKHLLNRQLSAGWNSWVTMAAEWREAKELMRRGASYLVHHKLAPAIRSWLAAIGAAAGSCDEDKARTEKALRHLLHRGLSHGWVWR